MKFMLLLIGITCCAVPLTLAQNGERCQTPDNKDGTCVIASNCRPLVQFISSNRPLTLYQRTKIQEYQCVKYGTPQVCCPNSSIKIPTSVPIENHPNFDLLPTECGITKIDYRIFGGNKTSIYQFPWMALLAYQSKQKRQFLCGGSIINSRYILTAAHCFNNDLIGVRVGEHTISTPRDCEVDDDGVNKCAPPVQDVIIEQRIPHPSFVRGANDIGLIRLATPLNITDTVKPICLPIFNELINYNLTGKRLTVIGFGQIESGEASDTLLQAKIPVIAHEECRSTYASRNLNVTDSQLCAGDRQGTDSCSGDSGGPLQGSDYSGTNKGPASSYLLGVVSFGPKPCATQFYGLYTKVGSHMKWILDNMRP